MAKITLLFTLLYFSASAQEVGTAYRTTASINDTIYSAVNIQPYFSGGDKGLADYIKKSLVYPEKALDAGIKGVVVVGFVVNELGQVTQVEALKKVDGGCTEEAVRMVKNMPTWVPGQKNEKPVKVRMSLPIRFTLVE